MGSFGRSLQFTKNSWRVLKLDKELLSFPILNVVFSIIVAAAFLIGGLASGLIVFETETNMDGSGAANGGLRGDIPSILYGVAFYICTLFIANFFTGALIASALKRFEGGDPTVSYGIQEAKKRTAAIAAYSGFSGTVGYLLQLLQERLPFGGKIVAFLADAAWNVANVFSLPVIMTNEQYIGPINAMKQSIGIIRKTWREAAITNFGVGIIGVLVTFGYLIGVGSIISASAVMQIWPLTIAFTILALIGLFILLAGVSALAGIIKAAIYYYAVTGRAPEQFERELMEAAFTPKKAKKVFSAS